MVQAVEPKIWAEGPERQFRRHFQYVEPTRKVYRDPNFLEKYVLLDPNNEIIERISPVGEVEEEDFDDIFQLRHVTPPQELEERRFHVIQNPDHQHSPDANSPSQENLNAPTTPPCRCGLNGCLTTWLRRHIISPANRIRSLSLTVCFLFILLYTCLVFSREAFL